MKKSNLNRNEEDLLYRLDNLELYYLDNLHAKCYFNEENMIISSMNMYEYSEKNNREMGVLLNSRKDKSVYDAAVEETIALIKMSEPKKRARNNTAKTADPLSEYGFCIRTGEKIPFNPEKPFSYEAFQTWAVYGNPNFKERYCHLTGEESNWNISFSRPILGKKYSILKKLGITISKRAMM